MSIQSEIDRLKNVKTAIKDAIVAKGVEVPEETTFREYADKIGEIPSGNRKVTVHFSPLIAGGMANYAYTINNVMVMNPSMFDTFEMELIDGTNYGTHKFNVVCACNLDELPIGRVETTDGQRVQVYVDTNFSYFYVPDDVNEIYIYPKY